MKAREEAVRLSNLYNDSFDEAPAKRETYLRQLLKKIGEKAYFSRASVVNLVSILALATIPTPILTTLF
ncbi:MAG: maltose acetyltransferase domain-containing protein [Zymomonas mobilis]|uniref:maltose acetyltransferase domain-containing protein n=1 Tax=Zymomonas mobilis TaxID=542 RepID=UPI0039E7ED92